MSNTDPQLIEFLAGFVSENKRELFDRVLSQRTRHLTIVLEDLYQPQNASACLRSCEAFGVQDVHVIENRHEFQVDGEVARGGSRWLTLHRYNQTDDNTPTCLESLRQDGYRLIATVPDPTARPLDEVSVEEKAALLIGHEKDGLSPFALAQADEVVTIPMPGFTRSFNVSVAVALTLYELTTRLRQSSVDWQLTADEAAELRAAWIKLTIGYRLPHLERRYRADRARLQSQ